MFILVLLSSFFPDPLFSYSTFLFFIFHFFITILFHCIIFFLILFLPFLLAFIRRNLSPKFRRVGSLMGAGSQLKTYLFQQNI